MSVRRLSATAVVLAAFLLTACTSVSGGGSGEASCTAILDFRGHGYRGVALRTRPSGPEVRIPTAHMRPIGAGTFPPCSDTNHSHESALAARVARIDGVDPAVAVAVYPDGRVFVLPPAVVPRGLTDAPWLRGKASS
jgi:hypothetical protein